MTTFLRWFRWFRWVFLPLVRSCWRYWRHGIVRIGDSVVIHSIVANGAEQLMGPVPGSLFGEMCPSRGPRVVVAPGSDVTIEVENITTKRIPFIGMFGMTVLERGHPHQMILPLPPIVLAPRQRSTFTVRPHLGGMVNELVIASEASKVRGKS